MQQSELTGLTRQRRQLSDWLYEWQLEQALAAPSGCRAADVTSAPDSAGGGASPLPAAGRRAGRRGGLLKAGDVRLLQPVLACARSRPLYLLLLTQLGDGAWLVAPFGRFSVPAVPGEWRTGSRALHVGVLCGWHVRRVAAATLAGGWHAMTLSDARLAIARRLAATCCDSPELDAAASPAQCAFPDPALGPPLRHPDDPRRAYLAEEADRLAELGVRVPLRGTFALDGRWPVVREPLRYPMPGRDALLLAADKRADGYGDKEGT